ncbi:GNAT family N-acetyltransferase [Citreimonas salinaria]|uniref:Acetyltransferase, GNAT family n=1 Tax=Citreimonas salinaria TaxID=321339 RepID=A0A1H3JYM9_9RHOB|nr:GNAT family N-acetyltransferase [Citreimonas salinaria]SDY44428.1 Acetyltransferase, GNAT family [Citreimonas salinaria]
MSRTLTIRTATIADTRALDGMFQRSFMTLLKTDYPPSALVSALPVIGHAQPALIRSGRFFVAEQGARIVGAAGWSFEPPGGRPGLRGMGHLRHVAVEPRHARMGIGSALVAHVMHQARGAAVIRMLCQSTRLAVPFYAAMGFTAQGETVLDLPGGVLFPCVAMATDL